jgi:hypothetical protein
LTRRDGSEKVIFRVGKPDFWPPVAAQASEN